MSGRGLVNIADSVRARLRSYAAEQGQDYNLVLNRFSVERFLYRLSRSSHRDSFILKGATLFTLWEGQLHRPTRDVDFLGHGTSGVEPMIAIIREICAVNVEDDGLRFEPDSVTGERIRESQAYEGVRVRVGAQLGTAKIRLQIDIGFGDVVTPTAGVEEFPTLLKFPAPHLRIYPRETVVAEKAHAITLLGMANSRVKDFYDIYYLARQFSFDGALLVQAFASTFHRRGTDIPGDVPLALTSEFATDSEKQKLWSTFSNRLSLPEPPLLEEVVTAVGTFIIPVLEAARNTQEFNSVWSPPGPWSRR